jgi:hypothetical protein
MVATKAVSPLHGTTSYRRAVKQLLTSVVREIRTLRSVGAGSGSPLMAIGWHQVTGVPTAIIN